RVPLHGHRSQYAPATRPWTSSVAPGGLPGPGRLHPCPGYVGAEQPQLALADLGRRDGGGHGERPARKDLHLVTGGLSVVLEAFSDDRVGEVVRLRLRLVVQPDPDQHHVVLVANGRHWGSPSSGSQLGWAVYPASVSAESIGPSHTAHPGGVSATSATS